MSVQNVWETLILNEGDVYRYRPTVSWCHQGEAIARPRPDGRLCLYDTYWYMDQSQLAVGADFEFVFNLNEVDEVKHQSEWLKYASKDCYRITYQGPCCETLYIRKGAEPDLAIQIENAKAKVADAEYAVGAAKRGLEWEQQELAKLEVEASKS